MLCCCKGSNTDEYNLEQPESKENVHSISPETKQDLLANPTEIEITETLSDKETSAPESVKQASPEINFIKTAPSQQTHELYQSPTKEKSYKAPSPPSCIVRPTKDSVIVPSEAADSQAQPAFQLNQFGISELEAKKMATDLAPLIVRLENVASRLEAVAVGGGSPAVEAEGTPASVLPFEDIMNGNLATFISISKDIGAEVNTQAELVSAVFSAERDFLIQAARCKKPSQDVLNKLLEPISEKINAIVKFREDRRGNPFFNHLSTISESIPALGWISVSPTPSPFVKDMTDAGQFYLNRVLKEYKEKDAKHVDWCRAWNKTLGDLQAYIKQHHTIGIVWNPAGQDAAAAHAKGPAPPPPGGAPPPPPPPAVLPPAPTTGDDDNRGSLLSELSKGTDITKGLKKVSDDMKTHKNPNLRLGAAPYKAPSSPKSVSVAKPKQEAQQKPPVLELQGKKWIVEYQNNNKDIQINDTELKQTVYVYKCVNSTITIKGKINAILLDNCKKTAVVFENVLAAAEFINCQSIQVQVTGVVPTVSVDKTDGFQIYLSKDSLDTTFITAKSSEMNVLVPNKEGEFEEFAVPEQFRTTWNGKGLTTVCADV